MRIANDSLISSAVDMSIPWASTAIWCGHIGILSVSLHFSGSPEGTFKLQCSNDKGQELNGQMISKDVTNWTTIDGSAQLISESGDHTWSISQVSWRWTRVLWLPSAGTGSLVEARFNTKGY